MESAPKGRYVPKRRDANRLIRLLSAAALTFLTALVAPRPLQAQVPGFLRLTGSGLYPELLIAPRRAGKPDPRWRDFDWKYTEQSHSNSNYRLYFYESERWAAELATPFIQDQIDELSQKFSYSPTRRFDYILFTSLADFRQANVFDISEGVQGVTATTETTMALPYTGDLRHFRHVSKHELVHQFQVQKSADFGKGGSDLSLAPLWFIEGMAEYYSLDGLDAETGLYLRDLVLNPNKKEKYVLPKLFETGPLSFVTVYKVGQAKIAFFEETFGAGSAQRLFEALSTPQKVRSRDGHFKDLAVRLFETSAEKMENQWQTFVTRKFVEPRQDFTQSLDAFEEITTSNDLIDSFEVSPNGRLIAIRGVDKLTGVSSIQLIDQADGNRRVTVARDATADTLSLHFMQFPTLALSDREIVYIIQTTEGPEFEIRSLAFKKGRLRLGPHRRLGLRSLDLLQASSPAVSSDGRLAFVGLSKSGWPDIYVTSLSNTEIVFRQLTNDAYLDTDLRWAKGNIEGVSDEVLLASSNRTADASRDIFEFDPATGVFSRRGHSHEDQLSPDGDSEDFVFQSWASGSSQIHRRVADVETRLTNVATSLSGPRKSGQDILALGFKHGQFRLYRIPSAEFQSLKQGSSSDQKTADSTWIPALRPIPVDATRPYRPFRTTGARIDDIGGFVGTGGQTGLIFQLSDLMRDYGVSGLLLSPNNTRFTNANVVVTNREGRASWAAGAYRSVVPRLDTLYEDGRRRTFFASEIGALGSWQWPLGAFTYFEAGARAGAIRRFGFNDDARIAEWEARTPMRDTVVAPVLRIGHDEVLYELFSGPLQGWSLLLESQTNFFTDRGDTNQRVRFDGAYYWRIHGRTVLGFEALVATSNGAEPGDAYLVFGDQILRAYVFGDDRLLGRHVAAAKAELWFPLGELFGFQPLRGLLAYDAGVVGISTDRLDEGFTTSGSVGIGLNLPPIGLNFIWSYPWQTAPGPDSGSPVLHFTLRYLYF